MFYLVQREDAPAFTVASDIDPDYAAALGKAMAAGVEVLCYGCRVGPEEVSLAGPIPVKI